MDSDETIDFETSNKFSDFYALVLYYYRHDPDVVILT
jgi:hypothetical protein